MVDNADHVGSAVASTLDALDLEASDAGAAALARQYAHELDQAKWIERAATKVLKLVDDEEWDGEAREAVEALVRKLSARAALTTVGARLESVLNDLGATPAARAKQTKGAPPPNGARRASQLARMRSGAAS